MKTFTKSIIGSLLFSCLVAVFTLLPTTEVMASHFRGATLKWQQAGGNDITFTVSSSWRRSFFAGSFFTPSSNDVGDVNNIGSFDSGQGTVNMQATVTAVDIANDILFMEWTYTKTYSGPGNYNVSALNNCCRISSLEDNNNDKSYQLQTVVNVGSPFNNPPTSSLPPLVNLPINATNATFTVPGSDPDNDPLSFRVSTTAESDLVTTQPTGFSLATNGVATMNTTGRSIGQKFAMQIMIEDGQTKTPVDFIIEMVGESDPPTFVSPSPANNAIFNVTPPGNNLTFQIAANDPDLGQSTTLNSLGLPPGASMSPALPETSAVNGTAQSTFSWTPGVSQVGQYVLNYVAQDNVGIQAFRSVTINVLCPLAITVDNQTPPTCPGDHNGSISVSVQNSSGAGNLIYSWNGPGGFSSNQQNLSTLVAGTYNLRVDDIGTGCFTTATVTLIDDDTVPPTINCPANISVENDPGLCGAHVNYDLPTISDNCTTIPTSVPGFTSIGSYGGHSYFLSNGTATGPASLATAAALGAHLATIADAAENSFIASMVPSYVRIGLNDLTTENKFVWETGEPVNYTNWLGGEPNNGGGIENYTVINFSSPGKWNDVPAGVLARYVIEFDELAILTAGLGSGCFFPVGTTTQTFQYTDLSGNGPVSCSFTVTVTDDEDPIVTCPSDITQPNDLGDCGALVSFSSVSTDNCPGVTSVASPSSGSNFSLGTTPVTVTATDAAGNTASCSFNVTVNDTEDPVLSDCPSNQNLNVVSGTCNQSVFWPLPTVTDNCSATIVASSSDPSVNINFNPSTQDCEADFPVGTTTVTHTATDASGNTDECSMTVTVVDNEAPQITCPSDDISTSTDPNLCGATVAFNPPVGSDNCPAGVVTTTPAGQLGSGSFFEVGTTTLTFNVADAAGLTNSCSFDVVVTDNQAPNITCPNDISVNTDEAICAALITYDVTYADNCPGSLLSQSAGLASGEFFPLGPTPNTFVVTDASGNSNTCSFNVTVTDNEDPVINDCPDNISVGTDPGTCSAYVSWTESTADDNCSIVSFTVTSLGDFDDFSSGTFQIGTTQATFTATDQAGNTDICTFSVTVTDDEDPTVTCPNNITQTNDLGACGAAVDFSFSASDNCPGVTSMATPASGSFFEVGTTTVTVTATDAAGNTKNCTFSVTVTDDEDPTVTCPNNITQTNDLGACGAAVDFSFSASDNCPGVTSMATPASGNFFEVGTTTVTVTATDAAGNTKNCTFSVTVTDDEDPTVTCPNNITQTNDLGACGAAVDFSFSASDNCPGVTSMATPASGSFFEVGTTTVTVTATDAAGNTKNCTFSVTVTDDEDPTVTCPNNITQTNDLGACGAVVDFSFSASDNCPGVTSMATPASGSFFEVGTTTVTVLATDAAGNSIPCAFEVMVTDNEKPTITCPTNFVECGEQPIAWSNAVDDNCSVAGPATCSTTSGSIFHVGVTPVTCSVSDINGNLESCSFTVTINPLPNVNISASLLPFGCQGLGLLNANVLNMNDLTHPLTYTWSNGLGSDSKVIITENGTYTVTVIDGLGCSNTATISTSINPYTTLSSYTMISTKEAQLKESTVNGGIGVTNPSKKAKIKYNSAVNGFVQAADIDLKNSTINGGSSYPYPNNPAYGAANVTLPVFEINTMSNNSSPNLEVPEDGSLTISGMNNVFDKIEVEEGATLFVDASIGILYAEEIKTKDGASIIFQGNTEVRVQKSVDLYKNNNFGPAGPFTVNVYIEDDLKVKEGSNFSANVYALKKIESKGKSDNPNLMTGIFISEYKIDSDYATWNGSANCGLLNSGGQYSLAVGNDKLGFTAKSDEHQIKLIWLTNTEYKNHHFNVERSVDGVNFETLSEVERRYTGIKLHQYREFDRNPNVGPNFYRVQVFFEDGTSRYSEIRRIDFQMDLSVLNLWPNPTSSTVNFYNDRYIGKAAKVVITNNFGQPLLQQDFDALPEGPVSFEIDNFKDGFYWLTVKVEGYRDITKRFVLAK